MLNKIYKNYDVNKKYAIRKFAVGTFSVAIGLLATNMNELPVIGYTGPNIVHASEVTNWQPEGNIIAQGEDGVPWELYENGYLLFKPTEGKDTLTNANEDGYDAPIWKVAYGSQIKYVGFSGKVYAPEYSGGLFSPYINGDDFKFQPENIETNKIDTSKVKSMYYMFGNNTSISNLDLSNWNTSNVTNMKSMFRGTALKKLNLNNWDTSNVTDMSFMFSESNNITELDLNHLNTGKVKDMNNMFNNMKSLTTLNIENWDTSNVINMSSMFADSKSITSLNLNNWNTGKLINPTETEKIIKDMKKKIVKVGTKPKVVIEEFESPVSYVKDGTREKGSENEFLELGYKGSKYVRTTYKLNEETGEITPVESEPVIVNPTKTIIKVAAKDKVEIIKSNDKTIQRTTTYDVNPETGEITISNVTDKLISTNTPLIPNPEGADLPKVPEKNTNDKPEYTKPISTNSPTNDNGNLILPPVVEKPEFNGAVNSTEPPVSDKLEYNKPIENNEKPSETLINEKPEYTGPLSTNTPVDENGNLILPPVLEKPEYKGDVNSAEPPVENKPEYTEPISTNTPVDDNGDLILPPAVEKPEYKDDLTEPFKNKTVKEEKPVENKEQVKDKELPNTNSTSVITGFVSSLIGTLGLGYKSKRRK